ncbi:MAG: putative toxin-antitoxin system toxin component, PIN family [Saprospiraceae bacterium]|nr:putative toxin-antitoxin system toxin component, PIN family [Saprospiraceae bacterium]
MKIVLDTNILLVSISPRSRYHWVWQRFLDEKFSICVTTDILQEYEEIIGDHMGREVANTILQILESATNVELVTSYFRWNLIKTDYDDNKFVDCAITANAKYLVSHDSHFKILKEIPFPKVQVINLVQFQKILADS